MINLDIKLIPIYIYIYISTFKNKFKNIFFFIYSIEIH